MSLWKDVWKNIRELKADNKKKWKAKWSWWKARSKKQILAIALSSAWIKPKKKR